MGECLSSDDDCSYLGYGDEGEEEEEDERDYLDGFQDVENQSPWPNSGGSSTKVITKQSLLLAQKRDLEQVMDLLSLKEHHARTLLIHYRWDVEKVILVLVEDGKDKLYAEAGLKVVEPDIPFPNQSSSMVMCLICMEDVSSKEVTAMDCGHYFCNTCWTEHFIVKINEGQSKRIKCMAHKCNAICDEAKVGNLVSAKDPGLAEKFDRFILESYIEDNKRAKWCPSVPHCGNAIRVEDDEFCEVECACGIQFCFNCSSEAHSPCSCLMWELWSKKCRDESETVNWLTVHTQPCPKCRKSVEKNGGCNLVVCVCGQAFCWLCGGATGREHTYTYISDHSCGRYKEDHEKKAAHAKRELKRYIHYHNRYKAHIDSLEIESKLNQTILKQISKLEERESTSKDFSWVLNGLYRLFRSRRVLSYSYPFAYFMFGDDLSKNEMTKEERENKQLLFEDQQQQLEANVEKLSLLLEEPFGGYSDDRVQELRLKIIGLSVVTDKCCEKLYECIDNDLLGQLQRVTHIIAPYKSKGVEKASELFVTWEKSSCSNEKDHWHREDNGFSKLRLTI